jgi:hypothetical protein
MTPEAIIEDPLLEECIGQKLMLLGAEMLGQIAHIDHLIGRLSHLLSPETMRAIDAERANVRRGFMLFFEAIRLKNFTDQKGVVGHNTLSSMQVGKNGLICMTEGVKALRKLIFEVAEI